jgi:uncharacterized protein YbjT (DUF2867 family)
MIVVTGANGQLGRAVVEQLLDLVPATKIAVSVRDPAHAAELAARGVEVRHGDFAQTTSLSTAFRGAEKLLLISTDVIGPQRVELHRNAVEAAREAGVKHLLYTSIVDPDPASPFAAAADHAATEDAIRTSGLPFTMLRNGLYMEVLPMLLQGGIATGVVHAPADGPTAFVSRSDLAAATAKLLVRGGGVDEVLDFTGSEAMDLAQAAQIAGDIIGHKIERRVISDEAYIEQMRAVGVPAEGAAGFARIFTAMSQRRFASVSPVVGELLGRAPISPAQFLRQMLAQPSAVAL